MIGLRKWEQTASDDSFVFSRVGLDHVGVHVESRDELEATELDRIAYSASMTSNDGRLGGSELSGPPPPRCATR